MPPTAAFRPAPPLRHLAAACLLAAAANARAMPFELVYSGAFNGQEALNLASAPTPDPFAGWTAFTVRARFDDASPNLAPPLGGPFAGFRAYAPTSTTIEIAGARYTIDSIVANPLAGVTVAIFDKNSFEPGRYGIGLISDPVNDGAGFVADFESASPDFTADALVPTTFGDFAGVGHSSGVCLSGRPPACDHAVTPWVLHDADGVAWNLTLGNYSADYPVLQTPGGIVGPLNSAVLRAVPEPSSAALALAGLALAAAAAARRRR